MLSAFANCLKIAELRSRLLFTAGLIVLCRLVAAIPIPGVNATEITKMIANKATEQGGNLAGMLNLFTGGALENFAVGALGIMPYISASIILQLMTAVVPSLERLSREGDTGRQKITQYTRYLTLIICLVQGFIMARTFMSWQTMGFENNPLLVGPTLFVFLAVVTMTTATMLLMWLGEQITERGIGNGISLIITVSIISSLPTALQILKVKMTPIDEVAAEWSGFHLAALLITFFVVTAGTVAITLGTRKIPVQYAKRVVGRKTYGGQASHIPLRINYAGVMPIIFAQPIMMFAGGLFQAMPDEWIWARRAATAMQPDSSAHLIILGLMIMFFSYFWVATQFKPPQIADDLKRSGAYIPGIRPGKPTADFLDKTMTRLTFAGALFLTFLALLPTLLYTRFQVPFIVGSFFGGTSLLIMVGVMLDTMRQVESHLLQRHYDGFLTKGKLSGRKRG